MKIFKLKNNWILAVTFILILIFTLTVYKIYQFTVNETKAIHQYQQLEMAKSATSGIKYYLNQLEEELLFQSKYLNLPNKFSDYFTEENKRKALRSTFVTNYKFDIIKSSSENSPKWIKQWIKNKKSYFQKLRNQEVLFSKVKSDFPNEGLELSFVIAAPIFKYKNLSLGDSTKKISGIIAYVVNFDWLMQKFIRPLKLTKSDFAWVMDGDGRLIYHPNHKDMILRNIRETDSGCTSCHKSFEVQNQMLISEQLKAEYFIEGEPIKIMASIPLELKQEKWIFAISTYLPDVISSIQKNFILIFVLSIVIIILIVSIGSAFYAINTKKIKLEESQRHITQSQLLQEKLHHASKLASIGELVDSVAHEINTPTGVISAEADAVLIENNSDPAIIESIKTIKRQTKRISEYTRSLLNYSKLIPFEIKENDLVGLIDECLFLIGPKLRTKNITIRKTVTEELKIFCFDRNRVEQVLINLLNNAVDAVENNENIDINVSISKVIEEKDFDKWLVINISDNGCGIPKENLNQVFEPFYSTKPLSKGTGLGLSISRAVIQRHNGKIEVISEIDSGTNVKVYLPYITG